MQPRAISLRVVVALVGLSSGAHALSTGRGVAAARPRARVVRCAEPEWSPQEDWALQDQVRAYSAGTGADTATFWSAMAANVPALAARAPAELEARAAQLEVDGGAQVRPCTPHSATCTPPASLCTHRLQPCANSCAACALTKTRGEPTRGDCAARPLSSTTTMCVMSRSTEYLGVYCPRVPTQVFLSLY